MSYLLLTELEVHVCTVSYRPSLLPFNLWPKQEACELWAKETKTWILKLLHVGTEMTMYIASLLPQPWLRPSWPTSPVCTFSHCPSPCDIWPSHLPFSLRLPLHCHPALIVPLHSEHMHFQYSSIYSSPTELTTDRIHACYLRYGHVPKVLCPAYSFSFLLIFLKHMN